MTEQQGASLVETLSQLTAAVAVSAAESGRAARDVEGMRTELRQSLGDKVSRGEWRMRNDNVDTRFASLSHEVRDVKASVAEVRADAAARRAPWWSTAAVVAALGSLALTLFDRLAA